MNIDAGRLDRVVTILSPSASRDAAGQPVAGWTTYATCQGGYYLLLEREMRAQLGRAEQSDAKYLIRWRAGINSSMRLLVDGRTWQVIGTEEIGRGQGLWLFVRAVVN